MPILVRIDLNPQPMDLIIIWSLVKILNAHLKQIKAKVEYEILKKYLQGGPCEKNSRGLSR